MPVVGADSLATPEPFSVTVPMVVEPTVKVTDPAGVPTPGELRLTVAVKVASAGGVTGLGDAVTVVVVAALSSTTLTAVEVDPLKPVAPA